MADHSDDDAFELPIDGTLDLHAFRPRDVASVVEAYIDAACRKGLTRIRVVHGRGRGVQRGIVWAALAKHPQVVAFADDPRSHLGATTVALKAGVA